MLVGELMSHLINDAVWEVYGCVFTQFHHPTTTPCLRVKYKVVTSGRTSLRVSPATTTSPQQHLQSLQKSLPKNYNKSHLLNLKLIIYRQKWKCRWRKGGGVVVQVYQKPTNNNVSIWILARGRGAQTRGDVLCQKQSFQD